MEGSIACRQVRARGRSPPGWGSCKQEVNSPILQSPPLITAVGGLLPTILGFHQGEGMLNQEREPVGQ